MLCWLVVECATSQAFISSVVCFLFLAFHLRIGYIFSCIVSPVLHTLMCIFPVSFPVPPPRGATSASNTSARCVSPYGVQIKTRDPRREEKTTLKALSIEHAAGNIVPKIIRYLLTEERKS